MGDDGFRINAGGENTRRRVSTVMHSTNPSRHDAVCNKRGPMEVVVLVKNGHKIGSVGTGGDGSREWGRGRP